MKATSLNFDAAMARGERPLLIAYFSNGYGVRIWATQYPPRVADLAGDENPLDGSWKLDGSVKLGSDLGGILDRAGRLMEIGDLEEGSPDESVEEGFEQTDPARITLTLSNDDLAMSIMEAEENVLSALIRLTMIQPGATEWGDRFDLGEFRVKEYELERERMILECEEV